MTEEELQMLEHISQIVGFAAVLGLHNWRDIRLHIDRQFTEMEALRTLQKLKEPLPSPADSEGALK